MKNSKLQFSVLFVVLVLSFTITTVGAQSELPPVGQVDEDGDRVIELVSPLGELGGEGSYLQEPMQIKEATIGLNASDPHPVSPVEFAWVYDRTPLFKFTELPGATRYKLEVRNFYTDTLIYRFKGGANCEAGICELLPLTALKVHDITITNGVYSWRVMAKIGGEWQPEYSANQEFFVCSKGFTSTFTYNARKWLQVYGSWFVTDAGFLKTRGIPNFYSSVVRKETYDSTQLFYAYEVKMKRKETTLIRSNRLIVAGEPGDTTPEFFWERGYEFYYYDDGEYYLIRRTDGVVADYLCSGYSPELINEFGWNTITIWHNKPWLTVWINGTKVCDYSYQYETNYYNGGWVGIMEYGIEKNAFLVDKAKVWLSPGPPGPMEVNDGVRVPLGVPEDDFQPRVDGLTP